MKRIRVRMALAFSALALAACTAKYVQPESGPMATLITTVAGETDVALYLAKEPQQCASSDHQSRWHWQFYSLGITTSEPSKSKMDAAMRKLDNVDTQHQMLIRADREAFIRGTGTLTDPNPQDPYYTRCDSMTAFKPVAGRVYRSVWMVNFKHCALKIETSVDGVDFVPEPSARSLKFCPAPWP